MVGEDPFDRLGDGTMYVQPAVYCASLALWKSNAGNSPATAFAGHSLGEVSALACAGALDPIRGLELVALRGRLTQQAAQAAGGGMLAVRCDAKRIRNYLTDGLALASDNAPEQTVVSGPDELLDQLRRSLREARVKSTRLAVVGPFHHPAMGAAVEGYRDALEETDFGEPMAPVYSCVTARPFEDVRDQLAQSLTRTVRWREVLEDLRSRQITTYLETGPGHGLSGLVKRTLPGVEAISWDGGSD